MERHFLLFKDQLVEGVRQKTKENIILHGKFRLVENGPKDQLAESGCQKTKVNIILHGKFRLVENGPGVIVVILHVFSCGLSSSKKSLRGNC